jgi:hypothetical protein
LTLTHLATTGENYVLYQARLSDHEELVSVRIYSGLEEKAAPGELDLRAVRFEVCAPEKRSLVDWLYWF